MRAAGRASRLLAAGVLAWWLLATLTAPQVPAAAILAAVIVFVLTLWRPAAGLAVAAAAAPAGALLAAPPVRAAELCAWSCVAACLLRLRLPTGPAPLTRVLWIPAALYASALIASWLSLTIAGAAGVPASSLPRFLLQVLPTDHLFRPSSAPETWSLLQALAGLALFGAAAGIARQDRRTLNWVGCGIVASATVLAVATIVEIGSQWADTGFSGAFLSRYLQGERYSLHLSDVNAAGSLYALALVATFAYAWLQPAHRPGWTAAAAVLLTGLWLSGSRSAAFAAVGGIVLVAALQRQWRPRPSRVALVVVLFAALLVGASLTDREPAAEGSITQSAQLRAQFLETSGRMFASAPIFGVGVGRYFARSTEFMTPELRDIYGAENAHNYFIQQFAELGLLGGVLFVWLIGAVLLQAGRRLAAGADDAALAAVGAGALAYLVTCITGHPLLVPEAALPFWAAFGALGGTAAAAPGRIPRVLVAATVVAALAVVGGVAAGAIAYARTVEAPPEQGFHTLEFGEDQRRFRWMTREAVTYVPPGPGILRLELQAPEVPGADPLVVEIVVAGQVVDRRELPAGRWMDYEVAVQGSRAVPFQRVDLRANQEWTQEVRLGRRTARRPISVMAAEIAWAPLP